MVASVSRLTDLASTFLTTHHLSISLKKGYAGFLSHKSSVQGSAAVPQPHQLPVGAILQLVAQTLT